MFPTIHREPILIVRIDENNNIHFDLEAFQEIIRRANGFNIVFSIVIGGFQRGKTSLISLLTGNDQHQIGNGVREANEGITIDGPIFKNEIAGQWNIIDYINDNNTALFIIDIEGFGSHRRGNNSEQNTVFFSKLCAPFFSIASCIIYFADMNDNQAEAMQLISFFRMGQVINNRQINLLSLVRNIDFLDDVDYSLPDIDSYDRISQILANDLQPRLIRHPRNIFIQMRPLPVYNRRENPFNQSNSYYIGIRFVVNDILRIITNSNITDHMNVDDISNVLMNAYQISQTFNLNTIQNEQDVILNGILREVEDEINQIETIDSIINRFYNSLDNLDLRNYIALDEDSISRNLMNQYMTNFHQVWTNINPNYLLYNEVADFIRNINERALTQLNESIHEISNLAIEEILRRIDSLDHDPINVNAIIQRFIRSQNQINLSDQILIETNQNRIITQLITEYNSGYNLFKGINNIHQNYLQNGIIREKFEGIQRAGHQHIRREFPTILRNIMQLIVRKIDLLDRAPLNTDLIIANFRLSQSRIEVSNYSEMIETDENRIREILRNEYNISFRQFKNNINQHYYHINEVAARLNEIKRNGFRNIDRYISTIKEENIQRIENAATKAKEDISNSMGHKIHRVILFMEEKQNILKGITADKDKLNTLLVNLLEENATIKFYIQIRKEYNEKVPRVIEIINDLFHSIEDQVKDEMPDLIKRMNRRKHLQRFVNFLIGFGTVTASAALICTGVGAAIGAASAVAAAGTSAAATIGELAAAGATLGAIAGTIEGSLSGSVLSFIYTALNEQDRMTLKSILEED